jgi:tRNA A-37 threonylcarbamoyl transferase component Bud32/predicted nucleotidyltransferase
MSSVSPYEFEALKKCIDKVAKEREVIAACIYGSRVAGYHRPDSDIDLLVVLQNYPHVVKYVYFNESNTKLSALAVDREALIRDAKNAFLGEFVVGRLLHIYEPIVNAEFLAMIERTYKRRVILEEVDDLLDSTGVLGTEIIFPLDFVAFSKVRRRMSIFPSATYSYYKTYTTSKRNVEFALEAYHRVLSDIVAEEKEVFAARHDGLLQVSEKHMLLERRRRRLKLMKRLKDFKSYFVHTYAGRRIIHFAVVEAESKIRRRTGQAMILPDFMSCPRNVFWRLPEGQLIVDGRNWLDDLARPVGGCSISKGWRRVGFMNGRTMIYILKIDSSEYKIAVKDLAKSKAVKWVILGIWTSAVKTFRMDPLVRLGWEYKAIRYIRTLGLHAPVIEAVVLDKKLLVTRFVEGLTLADVISDFISRKGGNDNLIYEAGAQIAKIHGAGATLGSIKPKNIIVNRKDLYFTDVDQFMFEGGEPAWDIAQFISWGVKDTRSNMLAARIAKEFLEGYMSVGDMSNITRLAKNMRYIESFYPLLVPSIARTVKKEIKAIVT